MAKLVNDKYYTPVEVANYVIGKTISIVGEHNISEIVEPSVGNGAFLNHNRFVPHFGYDIEPECDDMFNNVTHIIKN